MYQLHRNVALSAEEQTPSEFIANTEPTVNCSGQWIKASVLPDGKSFTVQIGKDGETKTYQCP
jgi:competence protein ComEC